MSGMEDSSSAAPTGLSLLGAELVISIISASDTAIFSRERYITSLQIMYGVCILALSLAFTTSSVRLAHITGSFIPQLVALLNIVILLTGMVSSL